MKQIRTFLIYSIIAAIVLTVSLPADRAQAFSPQDLVKAENKAHTASLLDVLGSLLLGKEKWNALKNISNWDVGGSSADTQPQQTSSPAKEFVGFYAEWWGNDTSSYTSLLQHTDIIRTIAPFWATLDGGGEVRDRGGNDHLSVVKFAKDNNVQVLLLINNDKTADKNGILPVQKVLSSPALRAKAIDNIESYLKKYGLDGVNIDFEMVPALQRDNLTAFMRELSVRLRPKGYVVSIDVFPKQDESVDVSVAYDYGQLAKYADKIMIMTYDNHGAWSDAGPVADIGWVENSLKYALKFIPKEKLYLGVAAYGYDWSYGKGGKKVDSLDYKTAVKLAKKHGAFIKWDEPSKSPYFAYSADGVTHTVWFENSRSLKYKIDLIQKYDIAGAAMWKLGEEDPAYWDTLKGMFKNRR